MNREAPCAGVCRSNLRVGGSGRLIHLNVVSVAIGGAIVVQHSGLGTTWVSMTALGNVAPTHFCVTTGRSRVGMVVGPSPCQWFLPIRSRHSPGRRGESPVSLAELGRSTLRNVGSPQSSDGSSFCPGSGLTIWIWRVPTKRLGWSLGRAV